MNPREAWPTPKPTMQVGAAHEGLAELVNIGVLRAASQNREEAGTQGEPGDPVDGLGHQSRRWKVSLQQETSGGAEHGGGTAGA